MEDLELCEHIALKTIHTHLAHHASALDRFRREIQLARKIILGELELGEMPTRAIGRARLRAIVSRAHELGQRPMEVRAKAVLRLGG